MQKSRCGVSDVREKQAQGLRILTSDSCLLNLCSSLLSYV
jgi:hypothetical protein